MAANETQEQGPDKLPVRDPEEAGRLIEALIEVQEALAQSGSWTAVLQRLCEGACKAGGFDRAGFFVYEPERDEILVNTAYMYPLPVSEPMGIRVPVSQCRDGGTRKLLESPDEVLVHPPCSGCPVTAENVSKGGGPPLRACAAARAGTAVVGFFWADNALSGRPIDEAQARQLGQWVRCIQGIMYAALRLRVRELRLRSAHHLAEEAAAIAAQRDLDDILRMVRDGVVESGVLDRAGVYVYDRERNLLCGTWGTDRQGNREDNHAQVLDPAQVEHGPIYRVTYGAEPYVVTHDYTERFSLQPDHPMYGVRSHCAVRLGIGDRLVGVLVGDNLLSDRPITEEDLALVRSFAAQATVAILNAELIRELSVSRDHLDEEVRRRTEDVQDLQAEIASLLQAISHDLRSPVRAAEGFTSQILERYRHELPAQVARDLERVRDAAVRMGKLTENLLAISRLSRRNLERTAIEPSALVPQVVRELRPAFRHACVLRILPMPPMFADAGLIALLYHELLENALQATAETMRAEIEVGYADDAYYVKDNGRGFDAEYAHTLFDLFRRYGYDEPTVGAGLALAKRIVSLHGGKITAEGAPGAGAVFRFTIPPSGEARPAEAVSILTHGKPGS